MLKKPLCLPLVRKIDLHFPLGLEVTARNLRGVTIKDALDAIYKQFKKKVSIPPSPAPILPQPFLHPSTITPQRVCTRGHFTDSFPQQDDELDLPVLAGFEWDPEECYTRFVVHQKKEGAPAPSKKKKKGANADATGE